MSTKAMAQLHPTINKVVNLIQEKISRKPLFYITVDPERALGFEDIVENYFIIHSKGDDFVDLLRKYNVNLFQTKARYSRSADILKEPSVSEFIMKQSNKEAFIITFKNSERFVRNLPADFTLINPSYKLGNLFENKISQYEQLNELVNFPQTYLTTLQDTNYHDLKNNLGEFVIQFNRGHTGLGTFFIRDKAKFDELKNRFPKRPARVSKFIQGEVFTINACIYNRQTYMGGLSYQITGIKPFANKSEATIGNDWNYANNLPKDILEQISSQVQAIGNIMINRNYRGMFGVDLIVDSASNSVYIIEVNARQPASIPMFSKMQISEDQIPLNLLHIAEFMELELAIDPVRYNGRNILYRNAAQLFIRSEGPIAKTSGVYNSAEDKLEGYSFKDLDKQDDFLFMNRSLSRVGEERARFQFKRGIILKNREIANHNTILKFLGWN